MLILNIYAFLFLSLSLTNFFVAFFASKLTSAIQIRAVLVIYLLYTIVALQLYGFLGLVIVFLNLMSPPSFHRSNKSKFMLFLILEICLILTGYHSIFYIGFILNLTVLNKILNYDRLFFGFTGFLGTAATAGKKTLGYFAGPEFCLVTSCGAFLYGADQVDQDRKIQILDAQVKIQENALQTFLFKAGNKPYKEFVPEEKLFYETKTQNIEDLLLEKQQCTGSVQEALCNAADVLKDLT